MYENLVIIPGKIGGKCMELQYKEFDCALKAFLPEKPAVQQVAAGLGFTEGPVWCGDYLLFSDIPMNRIVRLDIKSNGPELTTFKSPSGQSNGLTLDRDGRLVICESSTRRVTRYENDGSLTVLAERYQGKRLNAPNDVAVRSDGSIYFTDPLFGEPTSPKELDFNGVYRISPEGTLSLLVDDFALPNGLAFSPDESILYVNDTGKNTIRAYDVRQDGSVANERLFFKMEPDDFGGPDGMKVDSEGNIYCTGVGGIWIITPEGKHLGTISLPELPANLAWGDDDWKTMYCTCRSGIYRIRFAKTGIAPYKVDSEPWL